MSLCVVFLVDLYNFGNLLDLGLSNLILWLGSLV